MYKELFGGREYRDDILLKPLSYATILLSR